MLLIYSSVYVKARINMDHNTITHADLPNHLARQLEIRD